MLKKVLSKCLINNKLAAFLIILGSISWSSTMIKSGFKYEYGYGFWGANGYDGVWHIALINNLARFNFENPVLSGELIKNYHIGFDLFIAILHLITSIPVKTIYFQLFPPFASIILGFLTYHFVYNWTKSIKSSLFALFFIYFGGSAAWILNLGESAFWSQQSISTLINPPFALSLIFILLGLIFMQKGKILLAILSFGVLIQIKAYAAILVLGGLFVSIFYSYILHHTSYILKIFLGSLILNLLLFFLVKNDGLSTFVWQPFWFLETMFAASDRLPWPKMAEAMLSYKNQSVITKFILSYGLAFAIFIFGNFWTRLLLVKDLFKKIDLYKIFMLSIVLAGTIVPTFFVQTGTPWNTIQFMYYSLFFAGILAGISVSQLVTYRKSIMLIVVLLTIPTSFFSLINNYLTKIPPAIVSNQELVALDFLNMQEDGVVLTYPFDTAYNPKQIPNKIPLFKYSNTSYVPAFSRKNIYFERTNVEIMGYNWEERRKKALDFFITTDIDKAGEFLNKNKIKYLYLVKEMSPLYGELFKVDSSKLGLVKIFENEVSIIYKYDKNFGGS